MPHDVNDNEVKDGDEVLVRCKVKSVSSGEEFCNVILETVYPMAPTNHPTTIALNTKQVEKYETKYGG